MKKICLAWTAVLALLLGASRDTRACRETRRPAEAEPAKRSILDFLGLSGFVKLRTASVTIRDEGEFFAGYKYVDMAGRDIGGDVTDAKTGVRAMPTLPLGYALSRIGPDSTSTLPSTKGARMGA